MNSYSIHSTTDLGYLSDLGHDEDCFIIVRVGIGRKNGLNGHGRKIEKKLVPTLILVHESQSMTHT